MNKMRYLLMFIMSLPLLASTAVSSAGLAIDKSLNALCGETEGSGECAEKIERYQLRKGVAGISRSTTQLAIGIDGGRKITLTNLNLGKPNGVDYRYIQYIPSIRFHLVHLQYYEGDEMLLLSNSDGKRYLIPDVPHVSPDLRKIVVTLCERGIQRQRGIFV